MIAISIVRSGRSKDVTSIILNAPAASVEQERDSQKEKGETTRKANGRLEPRPLAQQFETTKTVETYAGELVSRL